MKNTYIYILIGLLGLLSSCKDDMYIFKNSDDAGDGIKLTMSLSLPQMQSMQTRGVLDNADLNPETPTTGYIESLNLYMFVFENTGSPESNYLLTLIHGDRIKVTSTKEDEEHLGQILQTFTANVEGTSEKAIIHLVATADPDFETLLQNATDRTELGLFYGSNGLYTRNEYPAFWKRIDLDMPITKENAEKDEFKEKLSHVRMIRNFCRVTVDMDEEYSNPLGFVIDGYALLNQVNAAYVAAYSDNEPRGFVEFEASDESGSLTGEMKSYGDLLTEDKYTPARHPASVRAHKEEEASSWLPADGADDSGIFSTTPKYMFERPYQSQHRTFVVIKGHFSDTPTDYRYIKLDIGDIPEWMFDKGKGFYLSSAFEYRHLYRNFSYDIKINTIASKNVGSATAAGAVSGPATNNVGATVETQSITDISDGVDRMCVNETKFVIVDDDNGDPYPANFDLMWRYISDWQVTKANETQYIKYDYPGMELVSNDDSGIFGTLTPIANGAQWPEGWETDNLGGWSGMNISFNRPDETVRQKTVRLYYSNPSTNKPNVRLSRDITFVMRKRWNFVTDDLYPSNIEVYPGAYSYENNTMPYESLQEMRDNITPGYVGSQRGAQLTVMFELPDDLPESLFPLDFKIGFDRQNVENAYVGNAIVTTGPSMFEDDPGGVGVMRMQFIKTVTWDYYHGSGDAGDNGHKIVTARFITTNDVLDESGFDGDAATTRVRVTNPYFTLGEDDFERAAHEDVIDPTRNRYYWNFSYPEWSTFFSLYADHNETFNIYEDDFTPIFDNSALDAPGKNEGWNNWSSIHKNPHTLNNLYFAGYIHGTALGATYLQVLADDQNVTRSKDNAELWFNLNHTSETGFNINMKIEATNTSTRTGGNNDRKYYDRDVTVMLKTTTADGMEKEYLQTVRTTTPSGGGALVMETLNYNFSNDIPAGETITRVLIWSVKADCHTSNNNNDEDLSSATRYYSIDLTLTPK